MQNRLVFVFIMVFVCTFLPLHAGSDPFAYPVSVVILDAGHGGKDPGASATYSFAGGTVHESDLVLDIAKRVNSLLVLDHPSLQVIMTRSDDTFVPLEERCRIAYTTPLEPQSSALFVSIHINSAVSREAHGFEILTKRQQKKVTILDGQTPPSNIPLFAPFSALELNRFLNLRNLYVAQVFEETLSQMMITSRNRGVKEQDLFVLNASRVPSVLVEVGFLSNEEEAKNILSSRWRQQVAYAIAKAISTCL